MDSQRVPLYHVWCHDSYILNHRKSNRFHKSEVIFAAAYSCRQGTLGRRKQKRGLRKGSARRISLLSQKRPFVRRVMQLHQETSGVGNFPEFVSTGS